MTFTHALFYPWIDIDDIKDQAWLKTSLLYWDKISTIVPDASEDFYYQSPSAYFLQSSGILIPEFIEPNLQSVHDASNNFLAFLKTDEGIQVLGPLESGQNRVIQNDRARKLARIRLEKFSTKLRDQLLNSGRAIQDGEWLIADRSAADFYMTLLAAGICRRNGYAPVTDNERVEALSNRFKRGDSPKALRRGELVEGLLAKITLESVGIAEDTPFEDIILFRDDHKAELGNFRTEMGKLAQEIDPETSTFEALQQQVRDIHLNKIFPAISSLRDALKRARIRNCMTQLTSAIFTASIPFLPQEMPLNIAASVGIQLIAQGINYNLYRREQLTANPYSFVLKVEGELSS